MTDSWVDATECITSISPLHRWKQKYLYQLLVSVTKKTDIISVFRKIVLSIKHIERVILSKDAMQFVTACGEKRSKWLLGNMLLLTWTDL